MFDSRLLVLAVVVLVVAYAAYRSLRPRPVIKWSSGGYTTTWTVNGEGKLLINGHDNTPISPMSKLDLERHVMAMESLVASANAAGPGGLHIETVCIEDHIATGLWNEGSLTAEDLSAAHIGYSGIELTYEIGGKDYKLRIGTCYYDSYGFWVERPDGEGRWVRDVPDALELFGNAMQDLGKAGELDEDSDVRTAFDTVSSKSEPTLPL